MADYISNYSGLEIDGWGNRIATLESNSFKCDSRVNITLPMCNTDYITACAGYYEIWGPFVYVHIMFRTAGSGFPATTLLNLMNADSFPRPTPNYDTNTYDGYAPLSTQRACLPYITNEGGLRVSAQGGAVAANTSVFIEGIYRRKET